MTISLTSVCVALNAHVRGYHIVYEHRNGYPQISISQPYTAYDEAQADAMRYVKDHLDTIVTWDIAGNPTPKE